METGIALFCPGQNNWRVYSVAYLVTMYTPYSVNDQIHLNLGTPSIAIKFFAAIMNILLSLVRRITYLISLPSLNAKCMRLRVVIPGTAVGVFLPLSLAHKFCTSYTSTAQFVESRLRRTAKKFKEVSRFNPRGQ